MKTHSDELQTVVTIVESGRISLSAQQLGQNPSSVSRTRARMEEKLGVTLLKRTTRSQDRSPPETKNFIASAGLTESGVTWTSGTITRFPDQA